MTAFLLHTRPLLMTAGVGPHETTQLPVLLLTATVSLQAPIRPKPVASILLVAIAYINPPLIDILLLVVPA